MLNPWFYWLLAVLWICVGLVWKRDKVTLSDDDLEIGEKNETTTGKL